MTAGRYARHTLIPGWDQRTLATASVVVAGVGAVGSEAARLLAKAGVGRLLLCDMDIIEESNLSRGALYGPGDVGRPKAEAAAEALRASHDGLAVTARVADLRTGVGLAELRDASLVLSCLDSVADRVALSARCGLAGAGLLDAGTYPWGGEVRWFAAAGPCFGCGSNAAERAVTTWHVNCADPPGHFGASAPVSAMTAAWQSVTAVRLLFGLPVPAGAVRLDPVTGETAAIALKRDPGCPFHERIDPALISRTGLTADAAVRELLAMTKPGERVLTWAPVVPGDPLSPTTLTAAEPGGTLAGAGIPPGEILPVVSPPSDVRYLELETGAV